MFAAAVLLISLMILEVAGAPLTANKTWALGENDNLEGLFKHDWKDEDILKKHDRKRVQMPLIDEYQKRDVGLQSHDDRIAEVKKHVDKFEMKKVKLAELEHREREAKNIEELKKNKIGDKKSLNNKKSSNDTKLKVKYKKEKKPRVDGESSKTLKYDNERHDSLLSLKDIELPDHVDGVRVEHDGHLNQEYKKEILLGGEHNEFEDIMDEKRMRSRLKVIFARADEDDDGYLVKAELESWIMTKVEEHLEEAAQESNRIFTHLDANKDGFVTWREFHAHFLEAKGLDKAKIDMYADYDDALGLNANDKDKVIKYKFRWAEADDSPKDNQLNREEMQNFRHPEQSPVLLERMVKDIIENLDENLDGVLSEEEFAVMPARGGAGDMFHGGGFGSNESSNIEERKKEFHKVIDLDHNGVATLEELKVYVDPHNAKHAQLEAVNLVDLADENRDGKLSIDEVLRNAEMFFGSKIMNIAINFHDEF